ncbi:MAG: TonB-dependent receptor [Candidatus Binataceae bacterium]
MRIRFIFYHACALLAILASMMSPRCATAAPANQSAVQGARHLSGSVVDSIGKPIAAAVIRIQSAVGVTAAQTRTDASGNFAVELAPGTYQLTADHPGFESAQRVVTIAPPSSPAPLVLAMKSSGPLTLQGVTAQLNRARNDLSPETGSTAYRFDQPAIQRLPEGQDTALAQVLQQAPGVSQDSYGQGQEQIHVNGENGGGVQYRINGVFLPEAVTSFGELFSPRFVNSITLLTGVLPAQFGWRNEGVIDIHTKDGCSGGGPSNNNFSFAGGQHTTMQPSFEMGGCEGRFSYYVSGFYLQSDLGLQSPTASPDPGHDRSYQGQGFANLSWLINSTTRLSILAGTSVNYFQIPPEPGIAQQYVLSGVPSYPSADVRESEFEQSYYDIASLQGSIGADTSYQMAAFSRYYSLTYSPDPVGDLIYNGVAAKILHTSFISGLQEDTSYRVSSSDTLRAGFYFSGETIELDDHAQTFPAKDGMQTKTVPITIVDDHHQIAWLLGFYAQNEWHPTEKLTLNIGSRWDLMSAFVTQNQFSPRVGVEYALSPGTVLHGGYARYFKVPPFDQVALETVKTFADTTNAAPVNSGNDRIPAERDDYFDAGIRQRIFEGLNAGVDGFYKIGKDQLDLAQLAGSVVTAPLSYSQSRAWGSSFSLTYKRESLTAYFNFAYAVLQAKNIDAGAFLADDAAEISYIASHWVTLDDNQMFVGSGGASYNLFGFLLTTDAVWASGYRRGFANSGELPPILQFNAGIVRKFKAPQFGPVEGRIAVINVFDHSYEIRNGTGIGVFSPSFGPRRALYGGIRIPLGPAARNASP